MKKLQKYIICILCVCLFLLLVTVSTSGKNKQRKHRKVHAKRHYTFASSDKQWGKVSRKKDIPPIHKSMQSKNFITYMSTNLKPQLYNSKRNSRAKVKSKKYRIEHPTQSSNVLKTYNASSSVNKNSKRKVLILMKNNKKILTLGEFIKTNKRGKLRRITPKYIIDKRGKLVYIMPLIKKVGADEYKLTQERITIDRRSDNALKKGTVSGIKPTAQKNNVPEIGSRNLKKGSDRNLYNGSSSNVRNLLHLKPKTMFENRKSYQQTINLDNKINTGKQFLNRRNYTQYYQGFLPPAYGADVRSSTKTLSTPVQSYPTYNNEYYYYQPKALNYQEIMRPGMSRKLNTQSKASVNSNSTAIKSIRNSSNIFPGTFMIDANRKNETHNNFNVIHNNASVKTYGNDKTGHKTNPLQQRTTKKETEDPMKRQDPYTKILLRNGYHQHNKLTLRHNYRNFLNDFFKHVNKITHDPLFWNNAKNMTVKQAIKRMLSRRFKNVKFVTVRGSRKDILVGRLLNEDDAEALIEPIGDGRKFMHSEDVKGENGNKDFSVTIEGDFENLRHQYSPLFSSGKSNFNFQFLRNSRVTPPVDGQPEVVSEIPLADEEEGSYYKTNNDNNGDVEQQSAENTHSHELTSPTEDVRYEKQSAPQFGGNDISNEREIAIGKLVALSGRLKHPLILATKNIQNVIPKLIPKVDPLVQEDFDHFETNTRHYITNMQQHADEQLTMAGDILPTPKEIDQHLRSIPEPTRERVFLNGPHPQTFPFYGVVTTPSPQMLQQAIDGSFANELMTATADVEEAPSRGNLHRDTNFQYHQSLPIRLTHSPDQSGIALYHQQHNLADLIGMSSNPEMVSDGRFVGSSERNRYVSKDLQGHIQTHIEPIMEETKQGIGGDQLDTYEPQGERHFVGQTEGTMVDYNNLKPNAGYLSEGNTLPTGAPIIGLPNEIPIGEPDNSYLNTQKDIGEEDEKDLTKASITISEANNKNIDYGNIKKINQGSSDEPFRITVCERKDQLAVTKGNIFNTTKNISYSCENSTIFMDGLINNTSKETTKNETVPDKDHDNDKILHINNSTKINTTGHNPGKSTSRGENRSIKNNQTVHNQPEGIHIESGITENNQTLSNQTGSNQMENKRIDNNQEGVNHTEDNKTDINRMEGNQTDIDQMGDKQTDINRTGDNQTDINQTGNNQTDINQTEDNQMGDNRTDVNQMIGNQTGDNQTDIDQTGDNQTNINQTGDNQTDINQTDVSKMESSQTDTNQTESSETEGNQTKRKQTQINPGKSKQTKNNQAKSSQTEGNQTEHYGTENNEIESEHTESNHFESTQTESNIEQPLEHKFATMSSNFQNTTFEAKSQERNLIENRERSSDANDREVENKTVSVAGRVSHDTTTSAENIKRNNDVEHQVHDKVTKVNIISDDLNHVFESKADFHAKKQTKGISVTTADLNNERKIDDIITPASDSKANKNNNTNKMYWNLKAANQSIAVISRDENIPPIASDVSHHAKMKSFAVINDKRVCNNSMTARNIVCDTERRQDNMNIIDSGKNTSVETNENTISVSKGRVDKIMSHLRNLKETLLSMPNVDSIKAKKKDTNNNEAVFSQIGTTFNGKANGQVGFEETHGNVGIPSKNGLIKGGDLNGVGNLEESVVSSALSTQGAGEISDIDKADDAVAQLRDIKQRLINISQNSFINDSALTYNEESLTDGSMLQKANGRISQASKKDSNSNEEAFSEIGSTNGGKVLSDGQGTLEETQYDVDMPSLNGLIQNSDLHDGAGNLGSVLESEVSSAFKAQGKVSSGLSVTGTKNSKIMDIVNEDDPNKSYKDNTGSFANNSDSEGHKKHGVDRYKLALLNHHVDLLTHLDKEIADASSDLTNDDSKAELASRIDDLMLHFQNLKQKLGSLSQGRSKNTVTKTTDSNEAAFSEIGSNAVSKEYSDDVGVDETPVGTPTLPTNEVIPNADFQGEKKSTLSLATPKSNAQNTFVSKIIQKTQLSGNIV